MNGYNNNGIQIPTIIPPVVTGCPTGSTMINGKCTPISDNPVVIDPGTKSDGNKIKALEEAAALTQYAKAKAAGDMNAAAIAAAGVNPSALAAQESGAIGAASIAAKLRAAEAAQAAADAAARQASSLAAFKAKEAADAAASQAAASAMDYDERFRFRAAQGVMSASDSGFKGLQAGGSTTVNLTVNGSVSTEQDLVSAVRNGLLATQTNGNTLTLASV
jgi:membrane protein involved in colicin uptake